MLSTNMIEHEENVHNVQTNERDGSGTRWAGIGRKGKQTGVEAPSGTALDHCEVFNRKMVLAIKQHWNILGGNLRDLILKADLDLVANCC